MIELMRAGWGRDNPVFRQVFTSRFIPGASGEQLAWFNDLCLRSASAHTAAELLRSRSAIDVGLLPRVKAPTLVLHAREDAVCPLSEGQLIASGIPDAQFVELDSKNHILLEHEPAWARFCKMVLEFGGAGMPAAAEDHLSNIFDKLGVWTRAQAIVFARERGFTRPD